MKWPVLAVLFATVACGPSTRNSIGDDDNVDASHVGSGSSDDGCSAAAKLVYVIDESNQLSQFDPSTKTFHDLGLLNCPAQPLATPFSMGVDRTATAWVLYNSGELFHVDTGTLACTKTSWASPMGLVQFGMGFSTDTAGGTTDKLFVAGGTMVDTSSNANLATLDTGSMSASHIGMVHGDPELTGNSNGELWGFFPDDTAPRVEKIDKTTGNASTTFTEPTLAGTATAWAFAFYGGDYWIFLATDLDLATVVYQIDGTNGMVKGMTNTNTRTIVGAGVSTCAPIVIF